MKRCTMKLLLLLVVCSLCLGTLAGCSGKHGKTLLSLEDTTLSVNIYQLLLTRMKGTLAKHQYQVDSDAFWATVVDKNGSTYNDYFRLTILENAKTYVVGAYLFDHVYGLTLSDDAIAAIDAELAEFVEYDGDGSKTAFNQVLAAYGVNYDILRDAYIIEAKIAALTDSQADCADFDDTEVHLITRLGQRLSPAGLSILTTLSSALAQMTGD